MPPCPCPAQRGTPAPATVRPWGRWCPSAHNVSRPHLQLCTRAERSAYPRKLLVLPPQSQQHGLGRCRLSCNCMDMLVLQVTTAPRRQARGGHVACTPAAGRVSDLSTEVQTPARDNHRGQGMGHLPAVHVGPHTHAPGAANVFQVCLCTLTQLHSTTFLHIKI